MDDHTEVVVIGWGSGGVDPPVSNQHRGVVAGVLSACAAVVGAYEKARDYGFQVKRGGDRRRATSSRGSAGSITKGPGSASIANTAGIHARQAHRCPPPVTIMRSESANSLTPVSSEIKAKSGSTSSSSLSFVCPVFCMVIEP
jgi:hypothetical protein